MQTPKIEIRQTDDWISIRLDGVIMHGNHSISAIEMLDLIQLEYDREYRDDCEQDWLDWEEA